MERKKQLDIELMRAIAAFFVIFVHTAGDGYFLFATYPKGSIQFWCYLFVSIFGKFSSRLFFAILGALMLSREPEPLDRLWRRRIWKTFVNLLVWSLIYYLMEVIKGRQALSAGVFLTRFYTSNWNFPFWYLYAYLVLLMTLPLLQRIAQSLTNRDYIYLFALVLVFYSVLPIAEYLFAHGKYTLVGDFRGRVRTLATDIFLFPLLGYFLYARVKDFWNAKRFSLLWGANILLLVLSAYMTWYRATVTGQPIVQTKSRWYYENFTLIRVATIFVTCQLICAKSYLPQWLEKAIRIAADCSFGIYMTHMALRYALKPGWNRLIGRLPFHVNKMIAIFAFCAVVYICGCVVTLIMKRIPVLKKIV